MKKPPPWRRGLHQRELHNRATPKVRKRLTFTSSPARSWLRACVARSARVGKRVPVFELLRALTLYEHVAVVESLEISFDHVGTGVIDPHVDERMGNV
jgi:hypothetical protein